MATRLRGITNNLFNNTDPIYKALVQSGAKNIVRWVLKYTGDSSGSATEITAPDAAYDGSVEEVTTVLFTNTKINTLGSEYLSIPFSAAAGGGSETMHYFYVQKPAISTVTCATKAATPTPSNFHFAVFDSSETKYYCYMTKKETSTVTALAKADCVESSSFHWTSGATTFYIWLNKGSGVDPTHASETGVEADISGSTTANDVAEVIKDLIHAQAGVGCTQTSGVMTIVNDAAGDVADTVDEDTTFVIATTTQGGADPAHAGETGIACDISGATTAITVAEVIDGLIDLKADVACDNGGTADLPILNTNNGNVTATYDDTTNPTGFTIVFEDGGDDPSATGTGHACDISGATTAADVGTIFVAAITGVAGLTSTGTTTALIESDNTGSITDVAQSASSLGTITVVNQGRDSYEGGYLYLVSASGNDTNTTGGHTRKVTVEGWDENGDFVSDEVSMAGATKVKLGERLIGVSHMYGSLFGTGGQDAADAIILLTSNTANATTLLTIASGKTESNGARIYVPDGQNVLVTDMRIFNTTDTNTGATIVTPLFTGFETAANIDPDYDYLTAVVYSITNARSDCIPSREIRIGTDTAVIITKEREVGTVGNETFVFVMELYTFK